MRLLSQPGVEGGQRLRRIVLLAEEMSIYEALDAPSHRAGQGRDHQGGGHDRQCELSTGKRTEARLQGDDALQLHQRQQRIERSVDEDAVGEDFYSHECVEGVVSESYATRGGRAPPVPHCDRRMYPSVIQTTPTATTPTSPRTPTARAATR